MTLYNQKDATYSQLDKHTSSSQEHMPLPEEYRSNRSVMAEASEKGTEDQELHENKRPLIYQYQEPHSIEMNNNLSISANEQDSRKLYDDAQRKKRCCRAIVFFPLLFGIGLVIVSAAFKVESVLYINRITEQDGCPPACLSECYQGLPSSKPSEECDSDFKDSCDVFCNSYMIEQAKTYLICFYVFIAIGTSLIFIQVATQCVRYLCIDYRNQNKKTNIVHGYN